MSNFDETMLKRLTKLEREVERLRVKESPDMSSYLGISAKAADSDKLDGLNSTDFVLASGLGEWVTYTPTFTAATGTFADTTGSIGHYCTIGKVMHISIYFNVVDKGTASGVWYFSLPSGFTCSVAAAGYGREILLTGNSQTLAITSGLTSVAVRKYDNSSSIGTGHAFICNITLGV